MSALIDEFLSVFRSLAGRRYWSMESVENDGYVVFAKRVSSDINAELGLDLSERNFGLSLNPSLGVRHVEVSNLFARFFGVEEGAAQVGVSLSDLLYQARGDSGAMWTVESLAEVPGVARQVLEDVASYGEPFLASYCSLSDIITKLQGAAVTNFELGHLAVAYRVAGEQTDAERVLHQMERLAEQQPALLAGQTSRFLSSFRRYYLDKSSHE